MNDINTPLVISLHPYYCPVNVSFPCRGALDILILYFCIIRVLLQLLPPVFFMMRQYFWEVSFCDSLSHASIAKAWYRLISCVCGTCIVYLCLLTKEKIA